MLPVIVVCTSAVIVLLFAEWAQSRPIKAAAKMAAASSFVAMALVCGALNSTFGQIMLAGLVLCWIGDACLLSEGRSTGFLVGIATFLLGHLFYAVAFVSLGIDSINLLCAATVLAVGAFLALRWLGPHVPTDFRIAVMSYIAVISCMVATSVAANLEGASLALPIGAIGFAASDLTVARERFVSTHFLNSAIGLPLYFGSQLLLAYSISTIGL